MTMDPCRVRVGGPLAGYATGFREELLALGYPGERAARHLQLLAQLSRWLDFQGLGERDLSEQRVAEFLDARRTDGYYDKPSLAWALGLLGHVPGLEVARAEPAPPTPVESAVAEFAGYLTRERGLAAGTVRGYSEVAELFLSRRATLDGELHLSTVNAESVTSFVVEESRRRSAGAAQVTVTALRSLLRFLFLEGRIDESLAQLVPAVSASKGFLPRGLDGETVRKLLAGCDASTAIGRRDLAVLTLLSRLGLRCGEVAGLELGDIDWCHGEVVIRGKGSRRDRLPLPIDVGEALGRVSARWTSSRREPGGVPAGEGAHHGDERLQRDRDREASVRGCRRLAGRSAPPASQHRHRDVAGRRPAGRDRSAPSPDARRHDGRLRQGRPHRAAPPRAAMAHGALGMSALHRAVDDYICAASLARLHSSRTTRGCCTTSSSYLEAAGATTITAELAVAWAQRPGQQAHPSYLGKRLCVVRGFARHLAAFDPATEVPSADLLHWQECRAAPPTSIPTPRSTP